MKLIESLLGTVQVTVGGETYQFERDEHGRAVCDVQNLVHRGCLLSVAHYREAETLSALTIPAIPLRGDDVGATEPDQAVAEPAGRRARKA